jgi:hypothetical protein
VKPTPAGNAPDSPNVTPGKPLAVSVKLPAVPTVNMVVFALVIAAA